jgi:hypothetical protein
MVLRDNPTSLETSTPTHTITQILIYLMYGIYFLVQRGEIIDDNYNGFQFIHH